jgi:hypothetical protein
MVPKGPVPTPLSTAHQNAFFFFLVKVVASPSPLPIADPNIPIAPATPAARHIKTSSFNFKVLHGLAIE